MDLNEDCVGNILSVCFISFRITGFQDSWKKLDKWYTGFHILQKVDVGKKKSPSFEAIEAVMIQTKEKVGQEKMILLMMMVILMVMMMMTLTMMMVMIMIMIMIMTLILMMMIIVMMMMMMMMMTMMVIMVIMIGDSCNGGGGGDKKLDKWYTVEGGCWKKRGPLKP